MDDGMVLYTNDATLFGRAQDEILNQISRNLDV